MGNRDKKIGANRLIRPPEFSKFNFLAMGLMLLAPITAKAQLYWQDHFESADWQKNYTMSNAQNFTWLNSGGHAGGCEQIRVIKGSTWGGEQFWQCKTNLGFEPEEMYAEFWVHYDKGMMNYKGKNPGFTGPNRPSGCDHSGAGHDWSARTQLHDSYNQSLHVTWYLYQTNFKYSCGDEIQWDNNHPLYFEKWHHVKEYIKLNTPGKNDGILKAWIDDLLVSTVTDRNFRNIPGSKIWAFWINYFSNDYAKMNSDGYVRLDDLLLYGPNGPGSSAINPFDIQPRNNVYQNTDNEGVVEGFKGLSNLSIYSIDGRSIEPRRMDEAGNGNVNGSLKAGAGAYLLKPNSPSGLPASKLISR